MSLLFSDFKKKILVSYPEGESFGTISKCYLSLTQLKLINIECKKVFYDDVSKIPTNSINKVGLDCIFIDSNANTKPSKLKTYCIESELLGYSVVDQEDNKLGTINNLMFCEESFELKSLSLSNQTAICLKKNTKIKVTSQKIIINNPDVIQIKKSKIPNSSKSFSINSFESNILNKLTDKLQKFTEKLDGTGKDNSNE